MRTMYVTCILLLTASCFLNCGSGNTTSSAPTAVTQSNATPAVAPPESPAKEKDTTVFVGVLATWTNPADNTSYDGTYDSSTKMFCKCSTSKYELIPPGQIDYQGNECGEVSKKLRVMEMKKIAGNVTFEHIPDMTVKEGANSNQFVITNKNNEPVKTMTLTPEKAHNVSTVMKKDAMIK